jgi:hypothetical protein
MSVNAFLEVMAHHTIPPRRYYHASFKLGLEEFKVPLSLTKKKGVTAADYSNLVRLITDGSALSCSLVSLSGDQRWMDKWRLEVDDRLGERLS